MTLKFPILLAIGLAISSPLAAQSTAAPISKPANIDPAIWGKSLELAKITASEDIIIGDSDDEVKATEMALELLKSDPSVQQLEAEFPGISKSLMMAVMPILTRSMKERLPTLWDRLAVIYAQTFTLEELDYLIGFYSSPTGQKMINAITDKYEPTAVMAEMKKSEDFSYSPEAVREDVKTVIPGIMDGLDDKDIANVLDLGRSTAFPKLRKIGLSIQQIKIDWQNEQTPWEEAAMNDAMAEVMADYGLQ